MNAAVKRPASFTAFTASAVAVVAAVLLAGCPRKDKGIVGVCDVATSAPTDAPAAPRFGAIVRKWSWEFEEPDGARTIAELVVPAGRWVHLEMVTRDEAHRMIVPTLGIDADVKPGQTNHLWIRVAAKGTHIGKCSDDCSKYGSTFFPTVKALTEDDIAKRRADADAPPAGQTHARWGQDLARKLGCTTCHAVDRDGPTGKKLSALFRAEGGDAAARQAILDGAKASSRPGIMPPFKGAASDAKIDALVAYLRCGAARPCSAACAGVDICAP